LLQKIAETQREQEAIDRRFGKTRLPNSMVFGGKRIVGVGQKVYAIDPKAFPVDFMTNLLMELLGSGWGNGELSKPLDQRHVVLQWYQGVCDLQKANKPNEAGVAQAVLTGPAAAWYTLAYDLWVLSHHSAIRDELIKRLKDPKTFQG